MTKKLSFCKKVPQLKYAVKLEITSARKFTFFPSAAFFVPTGLTEDFIGVAVYLAV